MELIETDTWELYKFILKDEAIQPEWIFDGTYKVKYY